MSKNFLILENLLRYKMPFRLVKPPEKYCLILIIFFYSILNKKKNKYFNALNDQEIIDIENIIKEAYRQ